MARLAGYPEPMNVEQFLAFYDTRPDGEKWELIDGELFMNATPVRPHQKLVHCLALAVESKLHGLGAEWEVIPGIGVKLSDICSVEPDLMIRPDDDLRGRMCDDLVVAFEVLSPSTRCNDFEFKRLNYASLPSLSHYIVVSPEQVEVRLYERATGWKEGILREMKDEIVFEALQFTLSLAEIYNRFGKLLRPRKS